MNAASKRRLKELNADYKQVTGHEAKYFHCPILNRDEKVALCQGHIIGKTFPNSTRTWTVQRADVDNFFGSLFESEFEKLQYRDTNISFDIFEDRDLVKKLKPTMKREGEPVEYFVADTPEKLPDTFTHMEVQTPRSTVHFALKMRPSDVLDSLDSRWTLEVSQDIGLPALVSLLKAAHLTLFRLVGYEYALSAGGLFLGYSILGKFYLEHKDLEKAQVPAAAKDFFGEYINLVRPIIAAHTELEGTVSDRTLYFAMHGNAPWALLVVIRTGQYKHCVLVPVLEDVERGVRFARFLKEPSESFEVKVARFCDDHWEVESGTRSVNWTSANYSGE